MTNIVRTYRSTDSSAPTLTGQMGSLLALLDACLVNGYGSQSAAGWTKPYTNSGNVGCYQNSATYGTGRYLSVNDNGPGAGGAREARMTGYETLSAVATGTYPWPTYAQIALGTTPAGALVCRKSNTADSTVRAWTLIADATVFYLFTETGDYVNPTWPLTFMFGDFFSTAPSDPYACMIIGRNAENSNNVMYENWPALLNVGFQLNETMSGHFIDRMWNGVGGSVNCAKHVHYTPIWIGAGQQGGGGATGTGGNAPNYTTTTSIGNIGWNGGAPTPPFPFPNGPDGGLYMSPVWLHHNGVIRGHLKGIWAPQHLTPLNHNDTFSGMSNLVGRSFLAQMNMGYNWNGGAQGCQTIIETSTTWS